MERQDGWGELEIIPGVNLIKSVFNGVRRALNVVNNAPLCASDHYVREHFVPENTGAAVMLDAALED